MCWEPFQIVHKTIRKPQIYVYTSIAYEVIMHSKWAWNKVTKNKGLIHKKYTAHQRNCGNSQADNTFVVALGVACIFLCN